MPYEFAWAVKDEPSYNDYAHQEKGDEKVIPIFWFLVHFGFLELAIFFLVFGFEMEIC